MTPSSPSVSELMQQYGWNHQPYQHQMDAWTLSKDRQSYGLFLEMGTGKSLITLMTATHLFKEGKIDAMVVVAPKSVYRNWSESEIPTHLSKDFPHKVGAWSSYAKKKEKEELEQLDKAGQDVLKILVINIEAFISDKALEFLFNFLKKYRCLMVIDESTTIKNHQAKRTKIAVNLGKFAAYRRICSGNPIPNGACDIWSQTEFLQKNLLGFQNFFAFRNRFAVMQDLKLGNSTFKKIVGYRDVDHLKSIMRKFSFIIKKEDCLDLPPKVYQTIDIAMGPKQTTTYNKMLADSFVQLGEQQATAQMVITQMLRLHQISSGFIKPDFGIEGPFDEPNDRLNTLLDLLEQAPGKVIVWCNYVYNVRQILKAVAEKFGEKSVVEFYGDTNDEGRRYAKSAFQDPNSTVRFMVSNPNTGKWGNTFTQATTVIYYSNSYNLEDREQSEDRAHRIGQLGAVHNPGEDPSVLYIDLQARGTVDEKIIKVLKNKKKLSDEIVASNWRWLLGDKV